MSTGDAPVVHASWTQPGGSFTVEYAVPLFHEIDFFVSEGYRRIAHGGIEVGGLLFGRPTADGIRLEAFLPIECEHAAGPSFKLSERDVAGLRQQMNSPPTGQAVIYAAGYENEATLFRGPRSIDEVRLSGPIVYVKLYGATSFEIQYTNYRQPSF